MRQCTPFTGGGCVIYVSRLLTYVKRSNAFDYFSTMGESTRLGKHLLLLLTEIGNLVTIFFQTRMFVMWLQRDVCNFGKPD